MRASVGVVRGSAFLVCWWREARSECGGVVGEERGVSYCFDVGSVNVGASPSAPPMVVSSGAVAARTPGAALPFSVATVRPPPTSATAVATTARRWLFFQRAI